MIAFLNGKLVAKSLTCAYIEVSGVGFEVSMSQTSLSLLPESGSNVMVHTYLNVSDSGFSLYGFLSEREEELFKQLIGVSGIGPKIALAALSTFEANDLVSAVIAQDVAKVSKIPGVGKKSAQRIILELKDKISGDVDMPSTAKSSDAEVSDVKALVRSALISMGFTDAECSAALDKAPADMDESKLLQYALKRLGS